MARPRTEDGKRVPLSTRVSEERAAAMEALRGPMTPSAVLDEALGMWIAARKGARRVRAPARRAAPVAAELARERARDQRDDGMPREVPFSSAPSPCPHPKSRVNKGLCGACGTYVG
jgi:hypothetical protein